MATSDSTCIQLPLAIDGFTVEIPLTKGYVTIVDAIDADLIHYKWHPLVVKNGIVYVNRYAGGGHNNARYEYMHRVILERALGYALSRDQLVDHKNGDGLLNTRSNLRLATYAENACNTRLFSTNTSGARGVYWYKPRGKWMALIKVNYKSRFLGYYDDFEDAVAARQVAEREYFGEFSPLDSRG